MTIYTHTHLIFPCQPALCPYILFKNFCIFGLPWWFQWLTLHASTEGGTGSIPSQRTKILHVKQHSQGKKKKSIFVLPALYVSLNPYDLNEPKWPQRDQAESPSLFLKGPSHVLSPLDFRLRKFRRMVVAFKTKVGKGF